MDNNVHSNIAELMLREIIEDYILCNETILQSSFPDDGYLYCNATFDGYTCWDYTRAGTRVYGDCPKFMSLHFGEASGKPFKDCNTDGTWFRHPETNEAWTDYSGCGNTERVQRALNVLYVYFTGYATSIIALVAAIIIFTCYRQLRCTRVTIHSNLFMSYILTGIMWITYYTTSSLDAQILVDNPIWCRVVHVAAHYMTLCNYAWMLCEGFYLHTVLVATFSNETLLFRICCFIGWGLPIIPCAIYTSLRSINPDLNNSCWHDYIYLNWILIGPVTFSLFINILFLINILRIVCSKVRAISQVEPHPVRQSLRATLTLIPLLGVQFILLPFRPKDSDERGQYVYDLVSALLTSFQGLLVALLFCFFNGEVVGLLCSECNCCRKLSNSRVSKRPAYLYSAMIGTGRASISTVSREKNSCNKTRNQHTRLTMKTSEL